MNIDEIPKKFYRGEKKKPVAKNVGQLKKLLEELPDDLPLTEKYQLTVFNIHSGAQLGLTDFF